MHRVWRWAIGVAVVVALAVAAFFYFDLHLLWRMSAAPPAEGMDSHEVMVQWLAAAKLPGAAVLRVEDGEVVLSAGYGLADVAAERAVTPETVFAVGSLSKPVTAAALMTLYEQGRVDLDADVSTYLPFSVSHPVFSDTPITLRQLLAHTGGIADSRARQAYYTLYRDPGAADSPVALADFLREYFLPNGTAYDTTRNFTSWAPGQYYTFSNVGYAVIGLVVEEVTGMPFDAYCAEAVFAPLGMTDSAWFYHDIERSQAAVPTRYREWSRRYEPVGFYGFPTYPDGGLKTTLADYERFVSVFLSEGRAPDGTQFLQSETVALMLTPFYPEAETLVGAGWQLQRDGSAIQTGRDQGVFGMVVFDVEAQRALMVFANGDGGGLSTLRLQVFLQRIAGAGAVPDKDDYGKQ